jgi:uncharacterized membrane protein
MISDLIVAGFDNAHTAFLACAALARLQEQLLIDGHDVAVVSRGQEDEITLRETVALVAQGKSHMPFWKTLVGMLFPSAPWSGDNGVDVAARLLAIGVDQAFTRRLRETIRPGSSAIFVLANQAARERVVGVIRGFRGKIIRTRLTGDDRKQWLDNLFGQQIGNANQEREV